MLRRWRLKVGAVVVVLVVRMDRAARPNAKCAALLHKMEASSISPAECCSLYRFTVVFRKQEVQQRDIADSGCWMLGCFLTGVSFSG